MSIPSENRPRLFLILIVIWMILQIPRFIAIPIIVNAIAGIDPTAWLFPAIVDIVVAVTAPFLAFAIWRKTGLAVWTSAIVWLSISIFDHFDAITAALSSPLPQIFVQMGGGGAIVPFIQTLIDATFIVLLCKQDKRTYFLGIQGN